MSKDYKKVEFQFGIFGIVDSCDCDARTLGFKLYTKAFASNLVETEESRDRSMILCNLQGFVFADLKPNVFEWICQIPTAATQ